MIIDGKTIAQQIREEIKKKVASFKGKKPGLAFVLIGEDSASQTYVRMKTKACDEVGFFSQNIELEESAPQEKLIEMIEEFNNDSAIDGILVQQPFPKHIDSQTVIESVSPEKDVDGFHPLNLGKALMGDESGFLSCTPLGIVTMLDKAGVKVDGKRVVIVGRSNIVGKPLAALLMQKKPNRNATVTVAHSGTKDLAKVCGEADILIAAIGKAHFIKKEMVKPGAVVIDVGINRFEGRLVGDVDYDQVAPVCSQITPVPGGVGPMTIAMLLSNTLLSYERTL